jgi:GT2 family glycosyltransferase
MQNEPIVAIVVTFERDDRLAVTMSALREQTHPVSCLVVDNGAHHDIGDGGADAPGTEVIRCVENLGPAGGFDVGLKRAHELGARWALLLNDDDVLVPGAVERLLEVVRQDPTGRVVAAVGSVSIGGATRRTGADFDRGLRYPPEDQLIPEKRDIDVVSFNGLLVNVNAACKVGGVRSELFMMWEEYDFCLRLRAAGYRIVALAEPLVSLPLHGTAAPYPAWRGYYEARNGVLTLRAQPHLRAWPWFVTRQCKFFIAGLRLPQPARRTRLRVRGLIDGARGRVGRLVEPNV